MIGDVFRNRDEAGAALAAALADRVSGPTTVLAIPRGGVAVAQPVARALGAPLDVVIPRKLRAPDNPELAIGAVAPGVMVLHERAVRQLGVPPGYIEEEAGRQEAEIARREAVYRGGRAPAPVAGRTVVVVDDGVATGATAVAALRWARAAGADRVVFAA
ncbi:MAG TPA: phosphoribosyltransferase family protein, partial [Actinomycetota bacterium]|nr:phosphoribosyltransferase family protein [Actinomycetota bacterium]